jgi:hypothetical protein
MGEKNKKRSKLVRVQFPKDSDAEGILAGIRQLQQEWAKKYPNRAHRLYPDKYPAPPPGVRDQDDPDVSNPE